MQMNELAPEFQLSDLQGVFHKLSDYRGRIAIVNFWSADCPYSELADSLILANLAQWGEDVQLLPIASNRNESAQMVAEAVRTRRLPRVLVDEEHGVADLYEAVTTPHVFVVDRSGLLRYRGAVDDVTFRQRKATRFYLKDAVDALLAGRMPALQETPAYGCTIVREI
jgi:peroxiredoxin